jgi:hypothetical protein
MFYTQKRRELLHSIFCDLYAHHYPPQHYPPGTQKTFRGFCLCKFLTKNAQEKHARRAGGGAAGFPQVPGFPANPPGTQNNYIDFYKCFLL